jgi:hypothetical protein
VKEHPSNQDWLIFWKADGILGGLSESNAAASRLEIFGSGTDDDAMYLEGVLTTSDCIVRELS